MNTGKSAFDDPPPPLLHTYYSTACLHDKHDECKKSCKFCFAPCTCECHAK